MLVDQFHQAAAAARNSAQLDTLARQLWGCHGEGHLSDADAEAVSDALQDRRAALAVSQSKAFLSFPRRKKEPTVAGSTGVA